MIHTLALTLRKNETLGAHFFEAVERRASSSAILCLNFLKQNKSNFYVKIGIL